LKVDPLNCVATFFFSNALDMPPHSNIAIPVGDRAVASQNPQN
jgi:hypothetical protein